eukprot:GEMP01048541.1.p1 GENE.GEMP01048541.1~~GEMP01048541.1.p1  ORF type:complete len:347 (+),score=51.90 GEMP01048541.1:122-1162(+)
MMLFFVLLRGVTSNGWLNDHNYYRCVHGIDPFIYSNTLARFAQSWCPQSFTGSRLVHEKQAQPRSAGSRFGENLSVQFGSRSEPRKAALSSWYDEIDFWIKGQWSPRVGYVRTPMIGHMTQMLWKGTTEVGCAQCNVRNGGTAVVCKYGPAGNVRTQFPQNMPRRFQYSETTKSACRSKYGGSSPTPSPKSRPTPGPTSRPTPDPKSRPTPSPKPRPTPGSTSRPTPNSTPGSSPTPGPASGSTSEAGAGAAGSNDATDAVQEAKESRHEFLAWKVSVLVLSILVVCLLLVILQRWKSWKTNPHGKEESKKDANQVNVAWGRHLRLKPGDKAKKGGENPSPKHLEV